MARGRGTLPSSLIPSHARAQRTPAARTTPTSARARPGGVNRSRHATAAACTRHATAACAHMHAVALTL
eukprot:890420-Prymnesium_polylepis.1